MASELNVGGVKVGDGTANQNWVQVHSTAAQIAGVKLFRGDGDSADASNNNFGMLVTDSGFEVSKFTAGGANITGRVPFLSISSAGLATFSGNTEHGGADGVQTFYAHGIAAGNTTWSVDVPCDSDAGIATVFKVEASFSHCNCGFSAILETWTATRATSATSYEVKREDSSDAGVWSVSKTSDTNFRVTHTAGTSSGTGPYWVKVTHRNA